MSQKSPCIKICMMDPDSGFCSGCFRTLMEIGRWSSFTEEEKKQVREELEVRKRAIEKENPPWGT
jgi:predicted Fe-S protein YdhL (DUF1289 family)